MAIRWRIAILLAVITTINYIDRSVFGVVAPVVRGEFGIGDADYGLITSGFLLACVMGGIRRGREPRWEPAGPVGRLHDSRGGI